MKNLKLVTQLFAVLALVFLFLSDSALAARQKKTENEYPDATREEPKAKPTETQYKKINKAYDLIEKDGDENLAKAKAMMQEVVDAKRANDADKSYAYQGLSQVAWAMDDSVGAMDFNAKAIATNGLPNNYHFQMIMQLAQMQMGEEMYEDALKSMDSWFALTGKVTADALITKGNALYRLDKFEEAADSLKKGIAMSEEPKLSWYQLLLASYSDQEKYEQAAEVGRELIAKYPNDRNAVMQLASVYIDGGKESEALAVFAKAYADGVLKDATDLRQLYQMYNYLEHSNKAVEVINKGIADGVLVKNLETYKALADSYALQDDFDNAIKAYGEAAPFSATGEMDYQRGHLLTEKERWPEAKQALLTAIKKGGYERIGESYILLGTAELELKNDKAAIQYYEKAKGYPSTKSMAESWLKSMRY